ncbi:MAG TPA: hypothetical protein VGI75_07120 [Pirellulales bacterium]
MADFGLRGHTAAGCLSISVDADLMGHGAAGAKGRTAAAESVLRELIDQFQRHRLPASWAFSEPAATGLARKLGEAPGHEIALAADADVAPIDRSRGAFVRSVVDPLRRAATNGIVISSLVLVGGWQPRHLDVLTKYGIRAVRSDRLIHSPNIRSSGVLAGYGARGEGVQIVCYGLWHVATTFTLQGGGWMANHAQMRLARRAIDRTILQGGICHCRIDAASLARSDSAVGLRHIDRFLREMAQLRTGGRLDVRTLRSVADLLAPKRTNSAARSILRVA